MSLKPTPGCGQSGFSRTFSARFTRACGRTPAKRAPEEELTKALPELAQCLQVFHAGTAAVGIACAQRRPDDLFDEPGFPVRGGPEAAQMTRRDPELSEAAAGKGDVGVELRITLLASFGTRREQAELFELAGQPRVDARALAKLGQVELGLFLAQAGTPALAVTCGRRGQLLADNPQWQKLVSLQPQNRLEPLQVVLAEEPVTALRSAWSEQPLVLEVADLRDRDVGEVVLEQRADGPDRQHPALRSRGHQRLRNVSRYLPICSSSPSSS